jgi:hypothetical protein
MIDDFRIALIDKKCPDDMLQVTTEQQQSIKHAFRHRFLW